MKCLTIGREKVIQTKTYSQAKQRQIHTYLDPLKQNFYDE